MLATEFSLQFVLGDIVWPFVTLILDKVVWHFIFKFMIQITLAKSNVFAKLKATFTISGGIFIQYIDHDEMLSGE